MNANFRSLLQLIVSAFSLLMMPELVVGQNDLSSYLTTRWQITTGETLSSDNQLEEGESNSRVHSGQSSYRFAFVSQLGQEVIASTEIEPCHLIRDLKPSLHVYCRQTGVQILARVVLPETESPSGQGPMTVWIAGESCSKSMRWTPLSFGADKESLYERFKAQLPVLRRQYGSQISDRNAFVDTIAVKLAVGSGQQEVYLDSLAIDGMVSANAIVSQMSQERGHALVQFQQASDLRPSLFQVNQTVINYSGKPFCIRAIEYNGEPMQLFRELGFNTLWFSSPPTLAQLQKAKDNNLRLIAPPPVEDGLANVDLRYDPILAWLVGDDVHWADQAVVKKRIDLIHQVDVREGRPTIVRARTGLADYSRAADILCVGKPVIGTSFPTHLYSDFLKQRYQLTQANVPMLAEVDTEIPLEIQQQIQNMSDVEVPLAVQPEQLRSMCFQAIAGGARGLLFRSQSRLDDVDLVTQQRRLSLRWVNQQIDQLQPWIMGGLISNEPNDHPNLRVYSIKSAASRLLMIHPVNAVESYTAGWSNPEALKFLDSGAGVSDQPYRMTPAGLIPATHRSYGHQMLLELENPSDWELIVQTEDPQVIRYVNQQSPGAEHTVLSMEQAELTSEFVSRLSRAMVQANRDPPELRAGLNRILSLRQSLIPMATSDDPLAYWNQTLMLQREVAALRYRLLLEAQQPHTWPTASPLTVHPMAVPLHWQSVSRFAQVQWSPNGLPGGDFESLQHTVRTGWRHHSGGGHSVTSAANLIADQSVEGQRCLSLTAATANNMAAAAVEHTPIWITSAPVSIPARHLVRIAGHIKIDQPIAGSIDGVTIKDSLGGEALQQRVQVTSGWQPFTIFRATNEPHTLHLTLSLNGFGTVLFDEVTVNMAPIPTGPTQPTRPLDLPPGSLPPADVQGVPATPIATQPELRFGQKDR